jgi:hypothetical protein
MTMNDAVSVSIETGSICQSYRLVFASATAPVNSFSLVFLTIKSMTDRERFNHDVFYVDDRIHLVIHYEEKQIDH